MNRRFDAELWFSLRMAEEQAYEDIEWACHACGAEPGCNIDCNRCMQRQGSQPMSKVTRQRLRIPIANLYMLHRWGHPINPDRYAYQVAHGSTSPPIEVDLATPYDISTGNYVHSYDPQLEEEAEKPYSAEHDLIHPLYKLSDGHHRLRGAQARGEEWIDAYVTIPEIPYYLKGAKRDKYEQDQQEALQKLEMISMQRQAMPMPTDEELPEGYTVSIDRYSKDVVVFSLQNQEDTIVAEVVLSPYARGKNDYQVKKSVNDEPEHPWGAYLYEKALEWVSDQGGHLLPDATVSESAGNVWHQYYTKRPDVRSKPVSRDPIALDWEEGEEWDAEESPHMYQKYQLKQPYSDHRSQDSITIRPKRDAATRQPWMAALDHSLAKMRDVGSEFFLPYKESVLAGDLNKARQIVNEAEEATRYEFVRLARGLLDRIEAGDFLAFPAQDLDVIHNYEEAVSNIGTSADVQYKASRDLKEVNINGTTYSIVLYEEKKKCTECEGTGVEVTEEECTTCGGIGSDLCRGCYGDDPTCPWCDGATAIQCAECEGEGRVPAEKVHCDECAGRGYNVPEGRISALDPKGTRVVSIEWRSVINAQNERLPYVWGGTSGGKASQDAKLIVALGRHIAEMYRAHVYSRLIVVGPFTPAGYAFSRMFADEVLNSPDAIARHAALRPHRKADIALSHPERYFDMPGFGTSLSQPVMETRDTMEGENRFPDMDGAAPLGRGSDKVPGLASEELDGTLGTGDGDLEGQTGTGFHEHEAAAHLGPLGQQLMRLRPQLAQATQQVLNQWQVDENGDDAELGGGGACDAICRAMSDVLSHIDADITDGGQDGDDHAYLVVYNDTEAYEVDIPPDVYETGGGYSWKKRPDARVKSTDVMVNPIPREWVEDEIKDGMDFEAEQGASLRMMVGPSADETPMGTSPRDPMDWMGRAADLRARKRVADLRTRQTYQEVVTLPPGRERHE